MSILLPITPQTAETPPGPVHRFTVEQYHQLADIGILGPEDRVELLEGWIVEKMNHRPAHGYVVGLLTQRLFANLPEGWIGRCQLPITTLTSEPEPDLAIVCGVHSDFRTRHPNGSEVVLIIEVADSSVPKDRSKASIYASARVKEYWIFNLVENQLEQFSDSDGVVYRQTNVLKANDIASIQIDSHVMRIDLGEMLGQ